MVTLTQKGDFKNLNSWLERIKEGFDIGILDKYGAAGVKALASATPIDSGKTASSWNYEIQHDKNGASVIFTNSNINEGVPIAIILQYGHGNGKGGYVQGRDYINPAVAPVFDEMAEAAWKEVTRV